MLIPIPVPRFSNPIGIAVVGGLLILISFMPVCVRPPEAPPDAHTADIIATLEPNYVKETTTQKNSRTGKTSTVVQYKVPYHFTLGKLWYRGAFYVSDPPTKSETRVRYDPTRPEDNMASDSDPVPPRPSPSVWQENGWFMAGCWAVGGLLIWAGFKRAASHHL
jgi:hypothetical protein